MITYSGVFPPPIHHIRERNCGVVGSVVADRAGKRNREQAEGDEVGGIAAGFPSTQVVLAVTAKRMIVFSFGQIKGVPKEFLIDYPLSDIHEITTDKKRLTYKVTIRFSDNSVRALEAGKIGKTPEFAAAVARIKG